MAWEPIGNIKGPKGDKGDKGDQGEPGAGSGASTWSEIQGKPTTFAPSEHSHFPSDINAPSQVGATNTTAYLRRDGIWAVPADASQDLFNLSAAIGDTDFDFLALYQENP